MWSPSFSIADGCGQGGVAHLVHVDVLRGRVGDFDDIPRCGCVLVAGAPGLEDDRRARGQRGGGPQQHVRTEAAWDLVDRRWHRAERRDVAAVGLRHCESIAHQVAPHGQEQRQVGHVRSLDALLQRGGAVVCPGAVDTVAAQRRVENTQRRGPRCHCRRRRVVGAGVAVCGRQTRDSRRQRQHARQGSSSESHEFVSTRSVMMQSQQYQYYSAQNRARRPVAGTNWNLGPVRKPALHPAPNVPPAQLAGSLVHK